MGCRLPKASEQRSSLQLLACFASRGARRLGIGAQPGQSTHDVTKRRSLMLPVISKGARSSHGTDGCHERGRCSTARQTKRHRGLASFGHRSPLGKLAARLSWRTLRDSWCHASPTSVFQRPCNLDCCVRRRGYPPRQSHPPGDRTSKGDRDGGPNAPASVDPGRASRKCGLTPPAEALRCCRRVMAIPSGHRQLPQDPGATRATRTAHF
jgi:hypothetical protein